jgi:hypothetical protein
LTCVFVAHGTFIGKIRLESQKPEQLPSDQIFHFGASTRRYILREKPKLLDEAAILGMISANELSDKSGLPEKEEELDVSALVEIIEKTLIFFNDDVKNFAVDL